MTSKRTIEIVVAGDREEAITIAEEITDYVTESGLRVLSSTVSDDSLITWAEMLEALPRLAQGQAEDLKVDTGDLRVWLSRVTYNEVSVETYDGDRWELNMTCPGDWTEAQPWGSAPAAFDATVDAFERSQS